jgi:hypothetical protein
MSRRPGEHQIRFTPALWAKWWAAREVDARTLALRAGIDEFRIRLSRAHQLKRR